jgi:hypothetical protein
VPSAFPHQVLVRPGRQLDALSQRGVTRDRTVRRPVQPHDLGQQVRIRSIRLRTRGRVPFPIPGHRLGVQRTDLVPGRNQGRDPCAALGLDPDDHVCLRSESSSGSGRCSPISACRPVTRPTPPATSCVPRPCPPRRPAPRRGGPRPSHHPRTTPRAPPPINLTPRPAARRRLPAISWPVLTNDGARHPSSGHRLLTTSGRTVCRQTSNDQMSGVLTRQPLPEPSLPVHQNARLEPMR